MPNQIAPKPKSYYRRKSPAPVLSAKTQRPEDASFHEIPAAHFILREDWTIQKSVPSPQSAVHNPDERNTSAKIHRPGPIAVPSPGGEGQGEGEHSTEQSVPNLIFRSDAPFVRLYHADCFQLLDAIAAKHPEGCFDAIFADPPYFLSNGGITCHAGRMVKVDKGDWDKSRGVELNHEFNREWLARCQRVLKPNGTIWVSGTHHLIFSIGYAMQQLGFKILNDIAWEKPNPPPNLSCRYFTHSTETILWAAKDGKSKHVFNYDAMRAVTGKQMKTVWRGKEFQPQINTDEHRLNSDKSESEIRVHPCPSVVKELNPIWTLSAPGSDEKTHGKHPTQKPVTLIERCLLASTHPGDLVLDPFLGGGTTAIAALRLNRECVGIETDIIHIVLAAKRANHGIISLWLRHFRVTINVTLFAGAKPFENPVRIPLYSPGLAEQRPALGKHAKNPVNPESRVESSARKTPSDFAQIDLDLRSNSINGSLVDDKPQLPTERIFHETKFVFLSCAEVERGAVVHTTVDVSLQEAWAKTPTGKKRETTHVVRCETEILRVRP